MTRTAAKTTSITTKVTYFIRNDTLPRTEPAPIDPDTVARLLLQLCGGGLNEEQTAAAIEKQFQLHEIGFLDLPWGYVLEAHTEKNVL